MNYFNNHAHPHHYPGGQITPLSPSSPTRMTSYSGVGHGSPISSHVSANAGFYATATQSQILNNILNMDSSEVSSAFGVGGYAAISSGQNDLTGSPKEPQVIEKLATI